MFTSGLYLGNVGRIKKYAQRSALFFISLILAFSLIEPGASHALSLSETEKVFNSDYKLSPLESQKPQLAPVLSESATQLLDAPKVENPRGVRYEETDKRTEFTSTFVNNDGSRTMKYSSRQLNFQKDGSWQKVDNTIIDRSIQSPLAVSTGVFSYIGKKPVNKRQFSGMAGSTSVSLLPLKEGIKIASEGKTIVMTPQGAKDVSPERLDDTSVIYRDAWPHVDIIYQLYGETVKEIIVLKSRQAVGEYIFSINGGKVIHHPTRAGELTIEGLPEEYSFSALTISLQDRGVISESRVRQQPTSAGDGIKIIVDKKWLNVQPDSSFPMHIDPTYNKDAQTYWMFKSDGYSCNASNCYANVGTLNDGGWKHWRTYFQFPYNNLAGKRILNATLYGVYQPNMGGETAGRTIAMGHANCVGYNCRGTQLGQAGGVGTDFTIDFTSGLQGRIDSGDYGAVWSLWGEEGAYKSLKPYYDIIAYTTYDTPTPMSQAVSPANGQVIINTQPSLKVNTVSDADGDAVEYYFRVATKPDCRTGALINSGWIKATQWTVPSDILQDGTTYYWCVYTRGATQTDPNWVRSFKVDLRTGKDSTQSYDTIGPVGIDIATGNATLSAGTHSMSALAGDIGLDFTYNTPNQAKAGLIGSYWNVASGYSFATGAPAGSPKMVRHDPSINFDWGTGTPGGGVNTDWFYVQWKGQFIAPATGVYKFGGSNDDNMKIVINGQTLYNQSCGTGVCYNENNSISLTAGQVVPLQIDYMEVTSPAFVKLYMKGPVSQQVVASDNIRTNPTAEPKSYGLEGTYYTDTGDNNIDTAASDPSRLMMKRQDTNLNFAFGSEGPAQGLRADNFLVRWNGYITVPITGSYKLGMRGDDGVRIKIKNGSSWTTTLDSWSFTNGDDRWGGSVTLQANTPIPIMVDYREATGNAAFTLRVQDTVGVSQNMPITWLTSSAGILPGQWSYGVDVGGSASYDRLRVTGNSVVLEDSTGSTHEYTFVQGGGYKPPVNEDGILTRNPDNSFTFIDVDGRTYLFDVNGVLTSLTAPQDDRQPAALKYFYAGDPSRLVRIEDGVTSSRYATLHYKGINDTGSMCDPNSAPNAPSTFFGLFSQFDQAPSGMLCAFATSDGKTTNFYYKNGQLVRIVEPGSQITDYSYDSLGRIVAVRDSLASDVVGAGIRSDDETVTTQIGYDSLGRVLSVKAPAATAGASRIEHTLVYGMGVTDMRVVGASEPNGYSRRVQYDALLRTVADTDLTGKTQHSEWDSVKDLRLSSTDATGLKSTTLYDSEDRPIDEYGPAPSAWFETSGVNNRKPLAAYVSQVPRVSTGYDEGLKGPAVTWYDVKGANMTLFGAPKAYTTGFSSNQAPESGNPAYLRHVFGTQSLPMQTTTANGVTGYGFVATGKFTAPQSGTYTFTMHNDDSGALFIDDTRVLSNWGTKTANDVTNVQTGTFSAVAGKSYRWQVRYAYDGNAKGRMAVEIKGPGVPDVLGGGAGTRDWSAYLKPGYNLQTSKTAYDAQLGNVTTLTQYENPAYGQVSSTTLDPNGLNYVSQATYEAPGAGYLRQTSKTLPGGGTTTYQYYLGSETRDNPCTPEVEAFPQAGRAKGKVEADPDGDGIETGRTTETVYGASGEVLAVRYNNDSWTCLSYDSRGRVVSRSVPPRGSLAGRIITDTYALSGNPLIASTTDLSGSVITERDLIGRVIKYTDARGNVTTSVYDSFGKLQTKTSPVGVETYEYDTYDRLSIYRLDGLALATVAYDAMSRIYRIDYPAGISLEPAVRDSLGRVSKATYKAGTHTLSDEITRSVQGLVLSGVENGVAKQYTYDKSSRLTNAVIGSTTFAYGFSTADSSCSSNPGNNINAGKSSNRTSLVVNGMTTTYCYDQADRLIDSSDPRFSSVVYDSHGNTVLLGDTTHRTELTYDVSDRNVSISESSYSGAKDVQYERDVTDRILKRTYTLNSSVQANNYFGYTSSSDVANFVTDTNGNVVEKYISLPGAVMVTLRPQVNSAGAVTYSLANIHGDAMATVDADGGLIGVYYTGPFGEPIPAQTSPTNTLIGSTYGYVGIARKITDADFLIRPTQMGARVYIGELGRFLQVDPIEGGTLNNYVYALDPVNQFDLSGKAIFIPILIATVNALLRVALPALVGLGPIKGPIRAPSGPVLRSPPTTPTVRSPIISGSRSAPLVRQRSMLYTLGNSPTTINGRYYTGHSQDAMQSGGIMPSIVENTIRHGSKVYQFGTQTYKHYDIVNDVTVVTNSQGGVVTAFWGGK